ncbi:MAG: ABC transporter ATP-binding protein [Symbiobacterium sp.]|uniref:ABC transporter ATP-binding protein n=1 Tax=Symbiobacterium sp. TaxID=1971213 RepID=UPI00346499D7
MIQLYEVSKTYRTRGQSVVALAPLSGRVEPGEFVMVTGRSGAGKSTLLALMGGLTRPDEGTVSVMGQDLWSLSDAERARFRARHIGFVFQFTSLIPTLTVLENLLLPASFLPPGEGGDRQRAMELLERVGLAEHIHRYPWQLSGGQQKRVAVARALLNRPEVLLLDEPTADLDEETEREVVSLFQEENRAGTTVVMVTHSTELVPLAHRHLVLSGGRVSHAR